ncbi:MAG: pilus assembly protein N-terminal domain-containing protein [Candidatus Sericytochromatia bacterium]|nr:pilus assembly protein N-terminal domain-containing protein [Candidatus Tanganyikabacteria bacterium]
MKRPYLLVLAFLACLLLPPAAPAAARAPDVVIPLGQTTVFTVPAGVNRVAIGDGTIAEVTVIPDGTNRTLLIAAKKPGITNFLVWQNNGPVQNYMLEVLSSRRPESIAIRIKVLEVKRGSGGKAGIDWSDSLRIKEAPPDTPFRLGLPIRDSLLEAQLDMLIEDKKAKLLAQPTLVTMNGREATFLAGGELPIVIATANSISIEWKPFGVRLKVVPVLEGVDDINLTITPEVSGIDRQNEVTVGNSKIPAIATRTASTSVALKSGQSVVLAGLLKEESREVASRIPIIGQIPVLGALFTTTSHESETSELIFVVSPSIIANNEVKPEDQYGQTQP